MAFSQSMKKGQIPVGCQLCESGAKIQWKCMDCSLLVCTKCKDKVHSKFKNAAGHKIIGIQEVGQFSDLKETLKFSDMKCKNHDGQACCMFCKTCKQLICLKCMTKIHNGHSFADEEAYLIQRTKISNRQKEAMKRFDDLSNEEKELDKLKTVNRTEYIKTKEETLAQKRALKRLVDQYADKFIGELDRKWGNASQTIDERKSQVWNEKKQIEERMSSAEEILRSNDFVTFFQNCERIGTSLQEEASFTKPIISFPKFVPGEITESTFGTFKFQTRDSSDVIMEILNCYPLDINCIHFIAICPDHSIWIADNINDQLCQINPTEEGNHTIAKVNIKAVGMVASTSNDLLFAPFRQSRIKKITKGEVVNSKFSVDPLVITTVHITRDNKVIIGARGGGDPWPASGKRVIIIMEMNGNLIAEYGYDRNNKQILTYCLWISSTKTGNIAVIDSFDADLQGRLVVFDPKGEVVNIYNGNKEIANSHPFSPISLVTISYDNMVVLDRSSEFQVEVLHIINCDGQHITCYNPQIIGIQDPYALAVDSKGHLFIGCNTENKNRQKLYELLIHGF